jgi:hypothetical protein
MVRRLAVAAVASFLTFVAGGTASASVIGSLTFTDSAGNPDTGGVVGPGDVIPIWLTFTLGAGSDPLTTDPVTSVVTSPTPALGDIDLFSGNPDTVDVNNDHLAFYVNEAAGCAGTFCPSPYTFNFNFDAPSFVTPAGLNLQNPGDHYTWELGTLTPNGGSAPAGTYDYTYASIAFYVSDLDVIDPDSGFPVTIGSVPIADTSNSAPLERTVVDPTPEPGTWMLMLTGLVLGGGALRRRIKTAAV